MMSQIIPQNGFRPFAIALGVVLALTLCSRPSSAEELSEFEKLLREAIQSNQNEFAEQTKPVKTTPEQKLEAKPLKTAAKPAAPAAQPVKADPKPAAEPPKTASKALPTGKTQKLEGGWEAVEPNNIAKDENNEERVLVADATGAAAPKPAPNASVWDAEPETISPKKQKGFDIVEETADGRQQTAEEESQTVEEETIEEETVAAETVEEVVEEVVEPKAVEAPVAEPVIEKKTPEKQLPPPEEPKTEKTVSKTNIKTDDKTSPKPIEPNSDGIDISSILNILAEDKGKDKPADGRRQTAEDKTADGRRQTALDKTADGRPELMKPEPLKNEPSLKPEAMSATPEPKIEKKIAVQAPPFDSDLDETKWTLVNPELVGDVFGKEKLKLMYDEIINGMKTRNITGRYDMWKNYARSTLRSTAGINTGSELDGRCRLEWYKKLYDEPIKSVFEADEFTRRLHHGLSGSHRHILESVMLMRSKMDVPARNNDDSPSVRFIECKTPLDAVNEVKRCLINAQMGYARYISTLTAAEKSELVKGLVPTFAGPGCVNGHTVPSRTVGRRLTDIIEKTDKTGLYDAAEALIPLTNTALLELLDKLPEDAFPTVTLAGQKVQRLSTAAGDIIIGGRENNVYDLDSPEMKDVVCVIDLGGNDTYRDGTCDIDRPVLAIIDLHGNDVYTGSKPGIQGGAVLGVSILVDAEGDDTYSAGDIAQGSAVGGVGMLFDFAGKDSYKGLRRVQGHALHGLGMLVDRKGNDKYHAAMWAQGFGAPGGFGVLEDAEGDDHYYCGGLYLDSYPEHPGYDGWGQGVGAGIRQVANGGIGALLEGSGNDVYEVDYFGHGGGYWLGVGFARDFGGNDIRHGTTLTAYTGGPRREAKWTRFANGFGCHYSLGYCFDDSGDDVYGGTIMGTGMAWDLSIGYLCDFNGSDKYTATGGMTQGVGAEGSIGILFSYGGNDQFMGRNQGYASSGITYHQVSNCGGNISFVINYGGNDQYGCGAKNNTYVQRGAQGGFLIDRPTDSEAAEDLTVLKNMIAKREQEIAEYDEAVNRAKEEAAAKGRRYVPRQRRPIPISADQQSRLGSVPDFNAVLTKIGAEKTNVK